MEKELLAALELLLSLEERYTRCGMKEFDIAREVIKKAKGGNNV